MPRPGQVVLSVASREALPAHSDALRRPIHGAAGGNKPLVVKVEETETLRGSDGRPVLGAAHHARRS